MRSRIFVGALIALSVLAAGGPVAGQVPCPGGVDVLFQDQPIPGPGHQTSELYAHIMDELTVEVPGGERGQATIFVAIVSQLGNQSSGVQGWSLTAVAEGDVLVTGATTAGTAGDKEPEGLFLGGFSKTDAGMAHQGFRCGENGFSTAVVLSFTEPVALAPAGTATILAVDLVGKTLQTESPLNGQLRWQSPGCPCSYDPVEDATDGQGGCGTPVVNNLTADGATIGLCELPPLTVSFVANDRTPFRRGDVNADGRTDISDAIRTFMYLFLGATAPSCLDAVDTDDSGAVDITDGITILIDFFRPGTGISAPGPFDCGHDPSPDALTCQSYTPACD